VIVHLWSLFPKQCNTLLCETVTLPLPIECRHMGTSPPTHHFSRSQYPAHQSLGVHSTPANCLRCRSCGSCELGKRHPVCQKEELGQNYSKSNSLFPFSTLNLNILGKIRHIMILMNKKKAPTLATDVLLMNAFDETRCSPWRSISGRLLSLPSLHCLQKWRAQTCYGDAG
jgi:hypothetical protein